MRTTANDPGPGAPDESGPLADDEELGLSEGDDGAVGTPLPPPVPADPILPPNRVAPY